VDFAYGVNCNCLLWEIFKRDEARGEFLSSPPLDKGRGIRECVCLCVFAGPYVVAEYDNRAADLCRQQAE